MSDLSSLLRAALRSGRPPSGPIPPAAGPPSAERAARRFLQAWRSSGRLGPDEAVLLRQFARWGPSFVPPLPDEFSGLLARAGVEVTPDGLLRAEPYRPSWLMDGVSEDGIDPPPVERRAREEVVAERLLGVLGYDTWQSQAQKEAAWAVLTAPPGSATLAALPTGSGKSLCFQLLPLFGTGLTVVVVPTVALALDQWRSAREVFSRAPGIDPRVYSAEEGRDGAPETLADLRAGKTRLVFTSPEACVSGRLRGILDDLALEGRLDNLVIDEAHIIESWGAFFRVDFQVLALRQRRWLELSGGRMRTLLLSATFTAACRDSLRGLFATPGEWREHISQRLRPEPVHHLRRFDGDEERRAAVLECAWHLPRPAILYTTEVNAAVQLAKALGKEGFRRVGCFTGETPAAERRGLLEAWREDGIDLMVATSAFGLGVDKADVRSVVHACLPENLHRFYQEVGRSGRDGWSSVCLLLPSRADERTARRMAPALIGAELSQERWDALWADREAAPGEDHAWRLRTGSRRAGLLGERTGGENVLWNKRLLLLLFRAGMLELLDVGREEPPGEEPVEWFAVRPRFNPGSPAVGEALAPHRAEELRLSREGLGRMLEYVQGERPLCRILRDLYGEDTVRVCGGCPGCRRRGREAGECPPLPVPALGGASPERIVVDGVPHPFHQQTAFIQVIRRMAATAALRRFVCAPAHHGRMVDLLARALGTRPPVLHRADTFGPVPFAVLPGETVAVLHADELHPVGLHLKAGARVVHLVTEGCPLLDDSGRYPFEADGASFHPTPDAWLNEAQTLVH